MDIYATTTTLGTSAVATRPWHVMPTAPTAGLRVALQDKSVLPVFNSMNEAVVSAGVDDAGRPGSPPRGTRR